MLKFVANNIFYKKIYMLLQLITKQWQCDYQLNLISIKKFYLQVFLMLENQLYVFFNLRQSN